LPWSNREPFVAKPTTNPEAFFGAMAAAGLLSACSGSASTNAGAACSAAPSTGACNGLTDIGAVVIPVCATGPEPDGTGGTIVDGTYVLTSLTLYDCTRVATFPQSQTLTVSGACMQGAAHVGGAPITTSQSFVVSGNQLTGSIDCPAGQSGAQTATFTATPTTLTLFHPAPAGQVEVYSRK
jgi:hypothetical protein